MDTITRANWTHVTLGEYAALELMRRADPVATLNAVWDDMHAHNMFADEAGPTRLTDEGITWITELRDRMARTLDEQVLIDGAREVLRSLGTLTVTAAVRS